MRQLDLDLNEVDSALHVLYAGLKEEGNTSAEIDALFENKYGITDATETYDD